ncbi:MAG: MAE_28990/MAE_18760 family HEPN-like nuclease [Limnohabitans sp.]|nr:MAE_28990/MAE_18760 family HEPN-like nuclease [Limnohabitans sp.]
MQLNIDFESRVEEVEIYFNFAIEIDKIETHKQQKFTLSENLELTVKRDLQKVIRANCYLILYNLIEATIRNGIWATFDAIFDDSLSFEELTPNIQNIWLAEKVFEINDISNPTKLKENIKTLLDNHISKKAISISKNRVSLSGNLDYRSIEKIIKDYGYFGKITTIDKKKLAKALLKIKNERNGLAHGNKSFRQSAEIITIQDLTEFKDLVICYLRDITKNITKYIDKKTYKKK